MYDEDYSAGGFFEDADYEGVEVQDFDPDRFRLGVGTHDVTVSKAGLIDTKNGKKFIIEFTSDGSKSFSQFLDKIEPGDEGNILTNGKSLRQVKIEKRVAILTSLGVPQDKIKTLDTDTLVGIDGRITLWKKGEYIQFGKFVATTPWVPKGGPVRREPVQVSAAVSGSTDLGEFGI